MTGTARSVDDYERLRAIALGTERACYADLGIIRHHGLATWIKEPPSEPVAQCRKWETARGGIANTASATTELTQLVAGIVIALTAEGPHG
jgi:hypothetical protein